ncbi:TIGR02556 family CRISPR-associated protein [Clostridium aestuarii]|uniref:TIGR02556 family CRISPR-associated protein n=1 Tax=Clostridium aestuarii TaxID=338193 RepID=A0ABT4D2L5_9CLOT|nr:TIGR02556 family CRISPR-associated protein [Clostridium aestuarii]
MEIVKKIGEVTTNTDNLLEVFIQDVSGNGRYNNGLEIILDESKDKFIYKGINLIQYDDKNKLKYLYRSGSSRGTDITPTAKVTDIEKTFNNKILKAFPEAIKFCDENFNDEKQILVCIKDVLNDNKETILQDLKNQCENIPKKEGIFITVALETSKGKKYIGDFKVFNKKIIDDALKKFHYSETYKKEVYKDKAVCSLCRQKKEDIFGLVGIFPFYTIDKQGYISGGFDYEKAWRNYPVCKECAVKLESGKRYLDDNLTFTFYGRKYYLIPKPIFEKDLPKVLKNYKNLNSEDVKDVRNKYAGVEENTFRFLAKQQNNISYDLMFIEKNNSALNILLNIEEVAPSRFKKIFSSLDEIRNMEFFENKKVSFQLLNNIFTRDNYNRYFLETIDKIISNNKLDYKFLMRFFNEYIIEAFKRFEKDERSKEKDSYNTATFRVFGFIYFIEYLNLFKNRKEDIEMSIENTIWNIEDYSSKKEVFNAFFKEANPFFDTNSKKAVFLTGYVAKKLLNIQFVKEQRKPFIPRLKGLKLNKKDIKRLIPEIQNKLSEYDSAYYDEIFNIISEYIVASNGLSNLSDLDIPMFFSMGMNMDKNFVITKSKDENELN